MDTSDADSDVNDILDFTTSPPIRVAVGTGAAVRDFFVHEALICSRSEFFTHALNGAWKEADERTVSLPDDEPEIFAAYLAVLYLNKLPVVDVFSAGEAYFVLSKLYVLAEKLIDGLTKQRVLAAFKWPDTRLRGRSLRPRLPEMDSIRVIYSGTPTSSPARKVLVDLYVRRGKEAHLTIASPSSQWLEELSDTEEGEEVDYSPYLPKAVGAADVPKDFLYDLCIGLMRERA